MAAPHPYNTRAASALRQVVASSHASATGHHSHEMNASQDEARKRRWSRHERRAASRRRKRQRRELQAHKQQRARTGAETAPAAPTSPISPAAADMSRAPMSEMGIGMYQGHAYMPITQSAPVPHMGMSEWISAPSPKVTGAHNKEDPVERSWPPQSHKDQMQVVATHLQQVATAVTAHPLTFAANLDPDAVIGSLHRALQICETAQAIVKPMSITEPAKTFGPTQGPGPMNEPETSTTTGPGGSERRPQARHEREGAPEPSRAPAPVRKRKIKHEPEGVGEPPTMRKSRLEIDPRRGNFMVETGPGGGNKVVEVPQFLGESFEAYQERLEELRLSKDSRGQ